MRKTWQIVLSIALTIAIIIILKPGKTAPPIVKSEVLNITASQVTIAWISEKEYKGRVFFRPVGDKTPPLSAIEKFGSSKQHEVVLTGLHSSTRYIYWLNDSALFSALRR